MPPLLSAPRKFVFFNYIINALASQSAARADRLAFFAFKCPINLFFPHKKRKLKKFPSLGINAFPLNRNFYINFKGQCLRRFIALLQVSFPRPKKPFLFTSLFFILSIESALALISFIERTPLFPGTTGYNSLYDAYSPLCLKKQLFSFSILSLILTSFCFSRIAFSDIHFPIHRIALRIPEVKAFRLWGGFISRESNFRPCLFNEKPGGLKPPGCRKRPVKFKAFD